MNTDNILLHFLDYLLLFLHIAISLFNLLGWISYKTRRIHLASVILTLISWIGAGYWYGWGYCILTDWHWAVKENLGQTDISNSFIKHIFDSITGLDLDRDMIDIVTVISFASAILLSLMLNLRDRRSRYQIFSKDC